MKAYDVSIQPVFGTDHWPVITNNPIQFPVIKKRFGRPSKGEGKKVRHNLIILIGLVGKSLK